MSALTVAMNVPVSSMPSRLTVLNPVSVKRHRVGAGSQILDGVLTGRVGHDRARLLDQRGTRRLDGDAGQHRT